MKSDIEQNLVKCYVYKILGHPGLHHTLAQSWGSGSLLWSQNDAIMLWLRLTATSNCFPQNRTT